MPYESENGMPNLISVLLFKPAHLNVVPSMIRSKHPRKVQPSYLEINFCTGEGLIKTKELGADMFNGYDGQ